MTELSSFPAGLRSFFLGQISEPSTNSLRLLLIEGAPQGPTVWSDDHGIQGQEVTPLDPAEAVAILWENYVSYCVRSESYAAEKVMPKPKSNLFERDASAFREFVKKATLATDDFPGKLRHFEIISEHHVIDVISTAAPTITRETVDPAALMKSTGRVFNRVGY